MSNRRIVSTPILRVLDFGFPFQFSVSTIKFYSHIFPFCSLKLLNLVSQY
jgi:hypothetical protein